MYYLVINMFLTSRYPVAIPSIIDSKCPVIVYLTNNRKTSLLSASKNLLKNRNNIWINRRKRL
jgi:hypothetical protein